MITNPKFSVQQFNWGKEDVFNDRGGLTSQDDW